MAQIAVTILDPRGRRSAQLVETMIPVREVIPPLVKTLQLPESATYELIPVGAQDALPGDKTPAACGVAPGAELRLMPERNRILKALLDKLYAEVEDHIKEQMWDLAKEKLEALLQLDPDYPDTRGLGEAIARRLQPGVNAAATAAASTASRSLTATPKPSRPLGGKTTGKGGATANQRADQFRLETQAGSKAAGSGCMTVVKWIVGIVVVGGAVFLGKDLWSGWVEQVQALLSPGEQVVLGTGDVQVTLRWTGAADLDLHVTGPDGDEIWFDSPVSSTGGTLDVDANAACREQRANPVENVFWPDETAPYGKYQVAVVFFQDCDGSGTADYEVTIKVDRNVLDVVQGTISFAEESADISTFRY